MYYVYHPTPPHPITTHTHTYPPPPPGAHTHTYPRLLPRIRQVRCLLDDNLPTFDGKRIISDQGFWQHLLANGVGSESIVLDTAVRMFHVIGGRHPRVRGAGRLPRRGPEPRLSSKGLQQSGPKLRTGRGRGLRPWRMWWHGLPCSCSQRRAHAPSRAHTARPCCPRDPRAKWCATLRWAPGATPTPSPAPTCCTATACPKTSCMMSSW